MGERKAGLAGAVLTRGIVLLAAPLLQLTPFSIAGLGLADLKPALLALLWLRSGGAARRAFATALVATAAGALLDAVTPSYDASPVWSWGSDFLTVAAELSTLGGFAYLAREARLSLVFLGVGTAISLGRLVEDQIGFRLVAAGVLCVGHVLLYLSLRRPKFEPQPFTSEAGSGLARWGGVELSRVVLMGGAILACAALSVSDRQLSRVGLGVILACAVLTAVGYRWLARFCDGAGVCAERARAMPFSAMVVALFILPDVAEGLFMDRDAALARAGVSAVVAALVMALALSAVCGAARRMARAQGRGGSSLALGVAGRALWAIPIVLVLITLFDSAFTWETRRMLQQLAAVLLVAFGAAWIASAILLLVTGLRVRKPLM